MTQRLGLSGKLSGAVPHFERCCHADLYDGLQHRINATKFRIPLWIGLALYVVAALVLIFSPADRLGFVLLYVFIAAVAAALVNPRKDAPLQLNITPKERARLNALIMASTVALSSPFWLSGRVALQYGPPPALRFHTPVICHGNVCHRPHPGAAGGGKVEMPLRLIFLCFRRQWVVSYALYGFRTLFCVDGTLKNKRNSALGGVP